MDAIGPYQVLEEIGRGGMGVVYRARHPSSERQVAIKVLLASDTSPRFLQEARAAGRLQHPGIVALHTIGEDPEGRPYMVMELVEGESVQDRLRREGPLPIGQAVEISLQLCDALSYAHRRGVIHRDLKPHNLILSPGGTVKLTDFGLGKVDNQTMSLTVSGEIMGTPAYMPPEQAEGDKKAMGTRSDVYGLGATLYAMLTGRPPFHDKAWAALIYAVLEKQPDPPSSLREGIPPALERVVLKCLEKLPEDRFDTMEELAAAIGGERRRATRGAENSRRGLGPLPLAAGILLAGSLGATWLVATARSPASIELVPGAVSAQIPASPQPSEQTEPAKPEPVPEVMPAAAEDPSIAEEEHESGMAHFKKQEFQEAIHAFDAALEDDPRHIDALRYRGISYGRLGRASEATRDLEAVAKRDPDSAFQSYWQIGTAWVLSGDHEAAIPALSQALELRESALVLIDRANAYVLAKAYRAALSDLQRADRLNPAGNQPAYAQIPLYMGHVYLWLNDPQRALAAYEVAQKRAGPGHQYKAEIEEAVRGAQERARAR